MKRYLKNLFMAMTGSDPFQAELEEAKEQLQRSAENMSSMQDMYYKALENWTQAIKTLEDSEKRCASLQVLTENLRERIREKDAELENADKEFRERMERMKEDYQPRLGDYILKIDELEGKH